MSLQTEFEFTLPHGYIDPDGQVYRRGRIRMATALDEIESVAHARVQANEAYLPIILLSRVVTQLGPLSKVSPHVIESLFAADLAYLEDVYLQLNSYEGMMVQTRCPQCGTELRLQLTPPEENE